MWKKNLFYAGIIVAGSGLIGPPLALAAGLAFGLSITHTFHTESRTLSKFLLQAAVVCLGFGMNLKEVVHAGASGFVYTAISITFALTLGILFGKMLQVGKTQSLLISFGTAICGGSAIAHWWILHGMLLPALSLFAVILAQGTERFAADVAKHKRESSATAGLKRGRSPGLVQLATRR